MKRIRLKITMDSRGYICDSDELAGTPWVGIGPDPVEAINSWIAGIGDVYWIVGVDTDHRQISEFMQSPAGRTYMLMTINSRYGKLGVKSNG